MVLKVWGYYPPSAQVQKENYKALNSMTTSPLIEVIQDFYNSQVTCSVMSIYDRDFIIPFSTRELPSKFCGIIICIRGCVEMTVGSSVNQSFVEFAIRDYDKPMGVATYMATKDMPERLRNALPYIEELKKLL